MVQVKEDTYIKKINSFLLTLILFISCFQSVAGVDPDFKQKPNERFTVYTGDGNYKQAYHWSFNENGSGPAVTIFLNHGSGSEWYDEIENTFGPCGPDYLGPHGDFAGSIYAGLCETDELGDELYLADFHAAHVPVGPELNEFMLKKIVGSTQFAAWYWQNAFEQFDSPVHIFMVGRYNVVKDPAHLDNVLYWLNVTDVNSVDRDTLPPYNFDGYGVDDIDNDTRPMHASADLNGFDNIFLYKAVSIQYPEVSLANLIIEGRSDGGSAVIALAADFHIWPQQAREFWSRNLPAINAPDEPQQAPIVVPSLTVADIVNSPALTTAFNDMLLGISENDLLTLIANQQSLRLYSGNAPVVGNAGEQVIENIPQDMSEFSSDTFPTQLQNYIGQDFYQDVKLVHSFYPGCNLDGSMEKNIALLPSQIDPDGDNTNGYQVALKTMFSFGAQDSLYSDACDERVSDAALNTELAGAFTLSAIIADEVAVVGEVFNPAEHGFDYKNVYKNQPENSVSDQAKAMESRRAIERVINQSFKEINLEGVYQLPYKLD